MTDAELLTALQFLVSRPIEPFEPNEQWRRYRDEMSRVLTEIDVRFRAHDEQELATLLARTSELAARLGQPVVTATGKPRGIACEECGRSGAHDPSCSKFDPRSETDAGMGRGGRGEPDVSAQEFTDELRDIRATNVAKRKRRLAERGL